MKKWTAVDYDISKLLVEKARPQKVTIAPGMKLQLVIELEDAAFVKLSKDPTWIQKMQTKANAKAQETVNRLVEKVKMTDSKASNFNAAQATIFTKNLSTVIEKDMQDGGKAMAAEVDKLFEEYKKGQADLMKFRIKSGGKIAMSSLAVVASTAAAVGSHGAATPLAIVSIVRSCVAISQECTKLALNADQFAKIIQGELKVLAKFMQENMEKAKTKDKALQSAKEIGLNMISGALGIETPSLKNCQEHIEVHEVDIRKLEGKSHDLSKNIHGAMDEEAKWRAKFESAKKDMPAKAVGQIVIHKQKVEGALHHLIESTIKVNEAIERAEGRQKKFQETLDAMKQGVPAWTGYAKEATGLAVDIALGMGEVEKTLETVLHVCIESEKAIGELVLDKAAHA